MYPKLTIPWLFGLLLLLAAPVLFFSEHLPAWAPVAALVWVFALILVRGWVTKNWLGHTPVDLILLGLLLLLPLNLLVSADRTQTLPRIFAFVADMVIFYAVAAQAKNRALRWAGWLILLGGLVFIAATVPGTHFFKGAKLPLFNRSLYDFLPTGLRLPGDENGFNPNMTAGLLALFLPPALALSLRPQNWGQRVLAIFTTLLLVLVIFLTQSRGAILGMMVAMVLVSGLMVRALRWLWWGGGFLITGAVALRGRELVEVFLSSDTNSGVHSLAQRTELWSRAIYAGLDFPFTGIGLGRFPDITQALYPSYQVTITADVPHAHNIYMQALAEMGYPGLVLHLAFWGVLLAALIYRIRHSSGPQKVLATGLLGGLVHFLIHGIVDTPTYSPLSAIVIWGIWGLSMAVALSDSWLPQGEQAAHD